MPTLEQLRELIINMGEHERENLGWPQDMDYLKSEAFMDELKITMEQCVALGAVTITQDTREHPCEFCPEEATWAIQANQGVVHLWCDDCDPEVRRVNEEHEPGSLDTAARIEDLKAQQEEE